MSTIAVSIIFLKKSYVESDKELLKNILNNSSDDVRETKKGRYWEVEKNKNKFTVDVRKTESQLHECEEELLSLNMLPDDAPETIFIISNNIKQEREQNLNFVSLLSSKIVGKLGGITSGTKYIS